MFACSRRSVVCPNKIATSRAELGSQCSQLSGSVRQAGMFLAHFVPTTNVRDLWWLNLGACSDGQCLVLTTSASDPFHNYVYCISDRGPFHGSQHMDLPLETDPTTSSTGSATSVDTTTHIPEARESRPGPATDGAASPDQGRTVESETNVSAIVGGIIGGLSLVCGTAIIITYLRRRAQAQAASPTQDGRGGPEATKDPRIVTLEPPRPVELPGHEPQELPTDMEDVRNPTVEALN